MPKNTPTDLPTAAESMETHFNRAQEIASWLEDPHWEPGRGRARECLYALAIAVRDIAAELRRRGITGEYP